MKKTVYARQTNEAQVQGISNCPECAKGHDNVRTKIYKFNEMDADHVTAWSKGGATTIENCQMLCKTHNIYHLRDVFVNGFKYYVKHRLKLKLC